MNQGQGGTANALPTKAPESMGLNEEQVRGLQNRFRSATRPEQALLFNVVLLNKHAGWTSQQIGTFYAIDQSQVERCIRSYEQSGIDGLGGISPAW